MSNLTDAINQNTLANDTVYPLGIPTDWSQYAGAEPGTLPPSGWSAVTGWGQIYPEAGAPAGVNANAQVQIQDFTTYVLLNTGQWVEVQSQSTDPVIGAHYVADYSNNASVPWTATTSNGVVTADSPTNGYVDHFYPETFGTFTPGTVEGVFVEAQMRTTDPTAELVGNLGADWWANPNAVYPNNAGAGDSNWELLTTNWRNFYATSLTNAQLEANPPPPLQGSTTPTPTPTTQAPAEYTTDAQLFDVAIGHLPSWSTLQGFVNSGLNETQLSDALVASQTYANVNNGGALVNPNGPEIPAVIESLFQHTLGHLPSEATLNGFEGMANEQAFHAFATSETVTNVVGSAVAQFVDINYTG